MTGTTTGATTLLEARYRTVLRLLPAYYRREREEEMVEVYLWDVDRDAQDQSRPTLGETASIVALAVRTRLGAAGAAPRGYALLGSAVRLFALVAVLLQAAAAVVDRALELTWAATGGPAQWHMFLTGFTGGGAVRPVAAVAIWWLPLLWTVSWFALLHGRRRLAQTAALLAALPSLWPFVAPLVTDALPPHTPYAPVSVALAWISALALCTAHHRDAPAPALPLLPPGLAYLGCCVVMGASIVLAPMAADPVWAPATCFLLVASGRLGWRARHGSGGADATLALAVLGLLVLALRLAALYPWRDIPMPTDTLVAFALQGTAALLVTAALAVVGGRDLASR
ncbi:hypothetical protein [Streptomyces scabiei]|uniref:hypothetical protein n=1 Tax=Streptomyces scabiei TaxID=1930 RepID=UPI0029BEFC4F|nr:hypothetical protein [Streptomyces scabiei]MDX3116302.1 hypothetical protein [Streptomyces scabiei]